MQHRQEAEDFAALKKQVQAKTPADILKRINTIDQLASQELPRHRDAVTGICTARFSPQAQCSWWL